MPPLEGRWSYPVSTGSPELDTAGSRFLEHSSGNILLFSRGAAWETGEPFAATVRKTLLSEGTFQAKRT